MADLESFIKHYMKVTGRSNLNPKERVYVRQLFDFLTDEKTVRSTVGIEKVKCPVCDTEFAVPTS